MVGHTALRTSTERQEAVDAGFARLVGIEPKRVLWDVLDWKHDGAKVPARKSPFGDENAAETTGELTNKAEHNTGVIIQ